jgi:hypothetical protein
MAHRPAPPLASARFWRACLAPLAVVLPLAAPGVGRAQDLVGCQLVEGTLQCVPGITASPQQQIRILEGEIGRDQVLEGAVLQAIDDLGPLVLLGETRQGQLLRASLAAERAAGLPASAFHWYRRPPGRRMWELITTASGPTYTLQPGDVAYQVMVVVAIPSTGGSQRSASAPVGPVKAALAGY